MSTYSLTAGAVVVVVGAVADGLGDSDGDGEGEGAADEVAALGDADAAGADSGADEEHALAASASTRPRVPVARVRAARPGWGRIGTFRGRGGHVAPNVRRERGRSAPGVSEWARRVSMYGVPHEPAVVVGVCLDPDLPAPDAARLARDLQRALAGAHPGLDWSVRPVCASGGDGRPDAGAVDVGAADPGPVDAGAMLARGRRVLLAEDLDVVVLVTGRALALHGRPVAGHSSPVQQSIVLSLPGLDVEHEPLAAAAARLVSGLLESERPGEGSTHVLRELAAEEGQGRHGLAWALRTLTGSTRLLVRMVLASRPWLLAARLSRTLVGAFAAAAIAIVTPDVWMLADSMEPLRLGAIAVLVLIATSGVLVIGGGLRERAPSHRVRRTVLIHNAAVWVSVVLGVGTLFAGLVVASLGVTLLVLPWGAGRQDRRAPRGLGRDAARGRAGQRGGVRGVRVRRRPRGRRGSAAGDLHRVRRRGVPRRVRAGVPVSPPGAASGRSACWPPAHGSPGCGRIQAAACCGGWSGRR